MTGTFQSRIPTLSDDELRTYLQSHGKFKAEAVAAAAAELRRRGQDISELEWGEIQTNLKRRDVAKHPSRSPRKPTFLHDGKRPRLERIHAITAAIVTVGLGSAAVIYWRAARAISTAIDLEPKDSKKYLRELEYIGGKANILANDLRHWFTGLWQGKTLASTVIWISLIVAVVFWFVTTHGHTEES